jgi:hypothetical protein
MSLAEGGASAAKQVEASTRKVTNVVRMDVICLDRIGDLKIQRFKESTMQLGEAYSCFAILARLFINGEGSKT